MKINLDDCWLFAWSLTSMGYSQIRINGENKLAHRVMYESEVGEIPEGLVLDHLCRTPSCVNPKHLEPVSSRVNILRGTGVSAKYAKRTHCHNGHELAGKNVSKKQGYRRCLVCHRNWMRNYYLRKRAYAL